MKFSKIQADQSQRLGYWMDWNNSYYTMSDENNYTIWGFLKKLYEEGKIYKDTDVVPWSGRSGTSYSQMEIIEGRKLVAHRSVFVRFPLLDKEKEYLLVWTTTPWTLTSNISAAVNVNLEYVKLKASDGSIYYFADENLRFQRLEKQFKDKKQWVKDVPKLKTIEQMFNERGGYEILGKLKGSEMLGWKYQGPFDELEAQNKKGGYPFVKESLREQGVTAIDCHRIIDGGKDNIGNDIVVSGEGTGIVHIATGCGAIDNKIGKKHNLVEIAPLNDEAKYIDGFGFLTGLLSTSESTRDKVIDYLKENEFLFYQENYPHVYPHCWRSGDELVYRSVDEWYINMDWRNDIKAVVDEINWIPKWGNEREHEWLDNMGDWMISKKRFWGLALPIWVFEDGTFHVVGSKSELKNLCVEGWDDFEGNSPHRPWIDKIKIKHPESGLIGKRIKDVGNPWLDAGIVPFSTLKYNTDKEYWSQWFPGDFVTECFPGQFRNWFYSLLAMSAELEGKAPFKTLLGHALVKDETGRDMHKSWGNAIWFDCGQTDLIRHTFSMNQHY
jgi:isoleucyl-tRNA synthetase